MIVTRKLHRLAVRWNPKDRDTYADCTPRFGNGDLRYILNKDVLAELERRGYDLRTLRFHVDRRRRRLRNTKQGKGKRDENRMHSMREAARIRRLRLVFVEVLLRNRFV